MVGVESARLGRIPMPFSLPGFTDLVRGKKKISPREGVYKMQMILKGVNLQL